MEHTRLKLIRCPDPLSLLEDVFPLEEEERIKVCILFWRWWRERNKVNAGGEIRFPQIILASIDYHVHVFRNFREKRRAAKLPGNHRWSPPSSEFLKINTDEAFHEAANTRGWGFTIRNELNDLIAAGSGSLKHLSNALHAEALAMLYAVNVASRISILGNTKDFIA